MHINRGQQDKKMVFLVGKHAKNKVEKDGVLFPVPRETWPSYEELILGGLRVNEM